MKPRAGGVLPSLAVSMSDHQLRVEEDEDGMRLDRWLRGRFQGLPQGRIGKLLRTGQIRVNGGRARASCRLDGGDRVRVPPLRPADAGERRFVRPATPGDVRMFERIVLLRDRSVLAINKPAGLAVQGGSGQSRSVDRIALAWVGDRGDSPRLVHRIDRDTSGVLLLGLNRRAAVGLAAAFRERRVRKTYWAAVESAPSPPSGVISAPLAPDRRTGRRRMRIAAPGDTDVQEALTEYATLAVSDRGACAWLALRPHTGRTHQIRSHLAAVGCPVLGDAFYGNRVPVEEGIPSRLFLHARMLEFPHPDSGEAIAVAAPVDDAMGDVWKRMGWVEADAPDDPFPPR